MKKLFMFAAAAALAMGVVGCAKDPGNDGGGIAGDGVAQMKVTFSLPSVPKAEGTRATSGEPGALPGVDIAALDAEMKVNTVTVFIFSSTGGAIVAADGVDALTMPVSDFGTPTSANGMDTYEMTTPLKVTAVAGARIWVGVNVPTALQNINNEAALLAAAGSIGIGITPANQFDDITTAGMTMMTETPVDGDPVATGWQGVDLVKYDEDLDNVVNITADLSRVATKVVATALAQPAAVEWTNDVTLTYTLAHYNVYNDAVSSYLAKHADGSTLSTLSLSFDDSYNRQTVNQTAYKNVKVGNSYAWGTDGAALSALAHDYFIAENNSTTVNGSTVSLNGTTTYAMVATQVQVSHVAYLDGTVTREADAADVDGDLNTTELVVTGVTGEIKWAASPSAANADLYIVVKGGETYIVYADGTEVTDAEDAAKDIEDFLTFRDKDITTAPMAYTYTYPESYVHFMVWLNKYGTNDYRIGRNEFIHIDVTGVKEIDGIFPGYPGDPTDPKKPIDPTDEEDPNNPDPKDPTEEVDPTLAQLNVKINIKPWVYRHNEVELSR